MLLWLLHLNPFTLWLLLKNHFWAPVRACSALCCSCGSWLSFIWPAFWNCNPLSLCRTKLQIYYVRTDGTCWIYTYICTYTHIFLGLFNNTFSGDNLRFRKVRRRLNWKVLLAGWTLLNLQQKEKTGRRTSKPLFSVLRRDSNPKPPEHFPSEQAYIIVMDSCTGPVHFQVI